MRLFLEIARREFRRHMTYRAAALAGLATNFFFGLLRAAVLLAFFGASAEVAGYSVRDAVTFTGLTQAVIGPLSLFHWNDVGRAVHSGEIASDLLKPMDYQGFWAARDAGRALTQVLWRGVTIMLAYALVFDIVVPPTAARWTAFVAAACLAWLVSFAWRFLVNLSAFWSPDARGIIRFAFILSWFASGFLMPLRFYPDWVVRLCELTPFPHTVNTVVEIYLGLISGPEVLQALLAQALWAGALIAAGRIVLRAGQRRLVVLGG